MTVLESGRLCFIELFICEALEPPAFNGHQLTDTASVPYAVPILCRKREHGFVRFFHTPSLLPYRFSVGGEYGSWLVLVIHHDDTGVFTSVVADTGILSCGDASGVVGNDRIGVHVYEVQSSFAAPSTCACGLGAGNSAWIIDTLTLRSGDELLEIFRIAAFERK